MDQIKTISGDRNVLCTELSTSFRKLVFFCLAFYEKRLSHFANICHDSMQNYLSQLAMHKKALFNHCFFFFFFFFFFCLFGLFVFLNQINIFISSRSKMDANYAEICRVGNFEAAFQQVPLVPFFLNLHNIVVEHQ